ncbi:MAG: GAF domain-containing sensor histidine kinase [Candidatus Omnitrophica bacterium]|nr:GAF domain-containing sensor histidine kinase [Candidatus Omnitrophota bacterium]
MNSSDDNTIFQGITQISLFSQISDICAAVNVVTSEEELLQVSLHKTVELFQATRGSIFILNEASNNLVLKVAEGMEREEEEQMVKKMGEGIVGVVALSKKPIFVTDIAKDERFENFKSRSSYTTPSFICSPLMVKDSLIGVINIADKEGGQLFKKHEMMLLDFLSSQIALNFRRTILYQDFNKVLQETINLKDKLGQSDQEAEHLKKQISIQEKFASIGKLAGGIAHEFNNPLDGVMRYTNLCLDHIKDDEVVRGYLLEIKHGLNRMANIVKNLLACSRNVAVQSEKIDFNLALERSLSSIDPECMKNNISVVKEIQENMLSIKNFGLERIIINLIRNAIDAMKSGGKIIISAWQNQNTLKFSVSDQGSGIAYDNIDKIFDPFFTTKDIDKGCGLGLTVVGEIVKAYDGKIDVESQPEKGTTFTITLPYKD